MSPYKVICIVLFFPLWIYASEMVPRYQEDSLPRPLTSLDEHLYSTSYQLQNQQFFEAAAFVKDGIRDNIARSWLDYHQIIQGKEKQTLFQDMQQFLEKYPYHPKRQEVYDMAERKKQDNNQLPKLKKLKLPSFKRVDNKQKQTKVPEIPKRSIAQQKAAEKIQQTARIAVRNGNIQKAQSLILSKDAESSLSSYEADQLLTKIARLYFNEGRDAEALAILNKVTQRSGDYIAEAWWISGLTSWRLKDYIKAKKYFLEITKRSWLPLDYILAAEFWLSRCSLVLLEYDEWYKPLFKAAQYDNEYYGILAAETLGKLFAYDDGLRMNRLQKLLIEGQGKTFAALMQLGYEDWAKEELKQLLLYSPVQDQLILSWLASELGWFDLAYKESEKLSRYYMDASASLPRMKKTWVPQAGMYIDEALTLAIIMQESRFDPKARSSANAQGLMQITKQTKEEILKLYNDTKKYNLLNPKDNIYIGQRYIKYLLSDAQFNQNLFLSLAAWNAGPSKARRWEKEVWRYAEEDPLFWVESLPIGETRLFIKKVSRNLWLYRQRLEQESLTLASLIGGNRPIYKDIDPKQNTLWTKN